ncbi:MAG: restriction endonuclease subunit S [Luteolibacter sp.]
MKWKKMPFTEVFKDASGGNQKTPTSELRESGSLAIVDQGKDLVAGYIDDQTRACKQPPPVIIFGDHTRALKFIDFPFGMGADGTKVLVPKIESDTKFLFHYLRSREVPSAGYSRHFKFLKEYQIPLPPLAEQKRIAAILDAADALRAKRQQALAHLDDLLQSTFLTLFGDPVTNPMGWEQVELSELIETGDKINYGVVQPGEEFPGGKPLVRVGDFVSGDLDKTSIKYIDPEIEKKYSRSRLNGRELLVSCVGSVGTISKVPAWAKGFNIARAVARVPLKKDLSRDFMLFCLRSQAVQRYFLKETRTVSQPTLNIGLIKTVSVISPPLPLQQRFAAIVGKIEAQKSRHRAHLAELDTLFASLQSRAFSGEL